MSHVLNILFSSYDHFVQNFLNSNVINHPTPPTPSNISGEKRGEQEERKDIYTKCTVFWM